MKLYARPRGWHFHADINCPMLQGGDFERFKYRRVYWGAVAERKLRPCACAVRTNEQRHTVATEMIARGSRG